MVIHTIGDSHSEFGWNITPVTIHYVGPKLCFSIGRDGINITRFGIQNGDTVIFCFGEIDCRCHIHKHITCDNSYESIISSIVDNYFEKIRVACTSFTSVRVAVYNVVPPVQRHNTVENPDYPYLGTDEERKQYVLTFNRKLREKCSEYGYTFFDVYDKYIDSNGYLNKSLSDNSVHIRNGCYIKEFVETYLK